MFRTIKIKNMSDDELREFFDLLIDGKPLFNKKQYSQSVLEDLK
jgi:hypothetical protein